LTAPLNDGLAKPTLFIYFFYVDFGELMLMSHYRIKIFLYTLVKDIEFSIDSTMVIEKRVK